MSKTPLSRGRRGTRTAAVLLALGLWLGDGARAAAATVLAAAELRGTPAFQAGQQVGIFLWTDDKGLHVRWSSDGKPVLVAGALYADKALGALTRFDSTGGGWVEPQGTSTLIFSSTVVTEADGFDLDLAEGCTVRLELKLDGKPADVNLVFAGDKLAHPPKVPVRFTYHK